MYVSSRHLPPMQPLNESRPTCRFSHALEFHCNAVFCELMSISMGSTHAVRTHRLCVAAAAATRVGLLATAPSLIPVESSADSAGESVKYSAASDWDNSATKNSVSQVAGLNATSSRTKTADVSPVPAFSPAKVHSPEEPRKPEMTSLSASMPSCFRSEEYSIHPSSVTVMPASATGPLTASAAGSAAADIAGRGARMKPAIAVPTTSGNPGLEFMAVRLQ